MAGPGAGVGTVAGGEVEFVSGAVFGCVTADETVGAPLALVEGVVLLGFLVAVDVLGVRAGAGVRGRALARVGASVRCGAVLMFEGDLVALSVGDLGKLRAAVAWRRRGGARAAACCRRRAGLGQASNTVKSED